MAVNENQETNTMTEKEYTEGNELISSFLKLRYVDGSHICPIIGGGYTKILEYHHNWNWIMAAWSKFRDLKFSDETPMKLHINYVARLSQDIAYGTIQEFHHNICNAIQWYNSIKKQ